VDLRYKQRNRYPQKVGMWKRFGIVKKF